MGFKEYLLFRVKTYGLGFLSIFAGIVGFGFIAGEFLLLGLMFIGLGAAGLLYFRYQWREHDIHLEQRKLGRR